MKTREKKHLCIYTYFPSPIQGEQAWSLLQDVLANRSHIQKSKEEGGSCITSVIYICTPFWPRTALAKCTQMLTARSSCQHQTIANWEPVTGLTILTATLQSHAKQEPASLLFYNRNACHNGTVLRFQPRSTWIDINNRTEKHVFFSLLRFNNCSQFTQQLFKSHLSCWKAARKKQAECSPST